MDKEPLVGTAINETNKAVNTVPFYLSYFRQSLMGDLVPRKLSIPFLRIKHPSLILEGYFSLKSEYFGLTYSSFNKNEETGSKIEEPFDIANFFSWN